jgi:hypothetical protein
MTDYVAIYYELCRKENWDWTPFYIFRKEPDKHLSFVITRTERLELGEFDLKYILKNFNTAYIEEFSGDQFFVRRSRDD